MTDTQIQKIFDNVLYQAETFLNEMGEFFPFGATFSINKGIQEVGVYDENYDMKEMIRMLMEIMEKKVEEKKVDIGIVCINVKISNKFKNSISALELKVIQKDIFPFWKKTYLPYVIDETSIVHFGEYVINPLDAQTVPLNP